MFLFESLLAITKFHIAAIQVLTDQLTIDNANQFNSNLIDITHIVILTVTCLIYRTYRNHTVNGGILQRVGDIQENIPNLNNKGSSRQTVRTNSENFIIVVILILFQAPVPHLTLIILELE